MSREGSEEGEVGSVLAWRSEEAPSVQAPKNHQEPSSKFPD